MPVEPAPQSAPSTIDLSRDLDAAASILAGASSVTCVAHENPDADTLGGTLAIAHALDRLGVAIEVVCDSHWPTTLDFLPSISRVRRTPHQAPDAVVFVDCASRHRAGRRVAAWAADLAVPIINVDHHVSNDRFGTINCIDPSAAATSEVVAQLSDRLGGTDATIATLLLAGILHDTDRLSVADTSSATLRRAADLVDAGADIGMVSTELFGRRPLSAMRLWGHVARGLEALDGGHIVVGTLTASMLNETDADLLDAEDLPDLVASVRGAKVAILLREIGPSETRVSVRTNGDVDAASLAKRFGGGGHLHAGGCTVAEDLAGTQRLLVEAARRELGGRPREGNRAAAHTEERHERHDSGPPSPAKQSGFTLWFTGLSGAGKTTISRLVEAELRARGVSLEVLDGDVVRTHLSAGLGFSKEDRDSNVRRIGWVCEVLNRHDVVAVVAAISPYRAVRDEVRARVGRFIEVHVDAPVAVLEERDTKGLYQKRRSGDMAGLTGVDDPYEPPLAPEVTCYTDGRETPEESARRVIAAVERLGFL